MIQSMCDRYTFIHMVVFLQIWDECIVDLNNNTVESLWIKMINILLHGNFLTLWELSAEKMVFIFAFYGIVDFDTPF